MASKTLDPDATTKTNMAIKNTGPDAEGKLAGTIGTAFSDKEVRRAFIRKVYCILLIQLLLTTGIASAFMFITPVKKWVIEHNWLIYIGMILWLVIYIPLVCYTCLRRSFPCNVIMLAIFTLVVSFVVGVASCLYKTSSVVLAVGICTACCLAITLFAFNTKYDFTSCIGVIFVLTIVLLIFGIIMVFVHSSILHKVYAGVGALIFMVFLAFDTQLLMDGKRYSISPEEYVFATIQLYVDIVQIFMFLLSLIGER